MITIILIITVIITFLTYRYIKSHNNEVVFIIFKGLSCISVVLLIAFLLFAIELTGTSLLLSDYDNSIQWYEKAQQHLYQNMDAANQQTANVYYDEQLELLAQKYPNIPRTEPTDTKITLETYYYQLQKYERKLLNLYKEKECLEHDLESSINIIVPFYAILKGES